MVRNLSRRPRHQEGDAVRITTAASSRNDDIAARQRRYVVSMSIRTVCFVAAVAVGDGWLRWALVTAALLLPYVAVVMANAASSKDDGFELPPGSFGVPELGEGRPGGPSEHSNPWRQDDGRTRP
jgi:Mn2+/Fe2+ NRAMP family transporter